MNRIEQYTQTREADPTRIRDDETTIEYTERMRELRAERLNIGDRVTAGGYYPGTLDYIEDATGTALVAWDDGTQRVYPLDSLKRV